MRKVLLFLTAFLTFGALSGYAQTYFCLNQTSGTQVAGGVSVTITQSSPGPTTQNFCGVGPYKIGNSYSNWYKYEFATPVTHARIQMVKLHDDDSIRIWVNGTAYNPGGFNAFAGTCSQTSANVQITPTGLITTNGHPTGPGNGAEVVVTITPNLIDSIRVEHIRHPDNIIASDVVYDFCFADDSCSLGFTATAESPACSGRDVQLDATIFPNTTYSWTSTATPTWSPSPNVRDPKLLSVNATHSGTYTVTATRGTCTYTANVNVTVDLSPQLGPINQTGPVCPGEADTIQVPNVNIPTGGRVYLYDSFGIALDSFDDQFFEYYFDNVQPIDGHRYYIFARTTVGCPTDTIPFDFKVNPDVVADLGYELRPGCLEDTVIFTDSSVATDPINGPITTWDWQFGDGSGSNTKNPTHRYQVPALDSDRNGRNYTVRLIVGNGFCADTVQELINILHPMWVHFTIDDSTLCQGDSVTFTNNSHATPATQPFFYWYYDDVEGVGDTLYNVGHRYFRSGVFEAKLIMEDFRGCRDSFSRTITVDSAGGIFFNATDTLICAGDEVIFQGDFSNAGANSVSWDLGDGVTVGDDTKVIHSYIDPGTYDVVFAADYRICPDTQFVKTITVRPYPKVYIGEDTVLCPNGKGIQLQALVNNDLNPAGVTYQWNNNTEDITSGIIVRHPGIYAVTVDLDGCTASDSLVVRKDCYIDIPNAFTPNGDGQDDYFLPRQLLSRSVTAFEMQIYNRWGEVVFETNSTNGRGWDGMYGGEPQPIGVYIYQIQVSFANGTTERYQGNVTLLR